MMPLALIQRTRPSFSSLCFSDDALCCSFGDGNTRLQEGAAMARGDQFALFLNILFLAHSAIAFAVFVLLGRLLNYRALKNRPIDWRVAGTIGVVVWAMRNIYVHAMNADANRLMNMDAFWGVVIPGIFLLAVVWIVRLVAISAR
jgi:hypothetical protein